MDGGLMIQTIAMLAQLLCHPGMMRVLGLADQQLTPSIDQFDAHGGHHSTKHTTPQCSLDSLELRKEDGEDLLNRGPDLGSVVIHCEGKNPEL